MGDKDKPQAESQPDDTAAQESAAASAIKSEELKKVEENQDDEYVTEGEDDKNESEKENCSKRFSSKNLIFLYCARCRIFKKKIHGVKVVRCWRCDSDIHFQCAMCRRRYLSHSAVNYHLKHDCKELKKKKNLEKENEKTGEGKSNNATESDAVRKPRFCSEGLVNLFCAKCKTSQRKVNGVRVTRCRLCNKKLVFECAKCEVTKCTTLTGVITHLKYWCEEMWIEKVLMHHLMNEDGCEFYEAFISSSNIFDSMHLDAPTDELCTIQDVRSIKEEIMDESEKSFTLTVTTSFDDIKESKPPIKLTRKIKRRKKKKTLKKAQSARRIITTSRYVKNIYHDVKNLKNSFNKSESADNSAYYAYHCETCNVTFPKPHRKTLSCCSSCREKLVCECRGCGKRYGTYASIYKHAKLCSSLAEPFVVHEAAPSRLADSDGNKEARRATRRSSKDKAFAFKQEHVKNEVKPEKYNPATLMKFYCTSCKESFDKIVGQPKTDCRNCSGHLHYQCIKCNFIYRSYNALWYHLQSCVYYQKLKA